MISPTIGRVVLFHPAHEHAQPYPALVCYVHGDRMINVAGFTANGDPFKQCSVPLLQDDAAPPPGFYAEWMPYQKGQAAKTEALEAQIKTT